MAETRGCISIFKTYIQDDGYSEHRVRTVMFVVDVQCNLETSRRLSHVIEC